MYIVCTHSSAPRQTVQWCKAVAALCAALLWLQTGSVEAQRENMIAGARPEAHMNLGWHGDVGAGAGVEFALAPEGFIDGVDDEFVLRPGGELFFVHLDDHGNDLGVAALLAVQWNFYVHPDWSLFPELGPAIQFGHHHHHKNHNDHHAAHLDLFLNLGARYHFNTRNALLMRLSWPYGLQVGLTF